MRDAKIARLCSCLAAAIAKGQVSLMAAPTGWISRIDGSVAGSSRNARSTGAIVSTDSMRSTSERSATTSKKSPGESFCVARNCVRAGSSFCVRSADVRALAASLDGPVMLSAR